MPGKGFGPLPAWYSLEPKPVRVVLAGEGYKIPAIPPAPTQCSDCGKWFKTAKAREAHKVIHRVDVSRVDG